MQSSSLSQSPWHLVKGYEVSGSSPRNSIGGPGSNAKVGYAEGAGEGTSVGKEEGAKVGTIVGSSETDGIADGLMVGLNEGIPEGLNDGGKEVPTKDYRKERSWES